MIDPNMIWNNLSKQTERLMASSVDEDIAPEVRDDIAQLIDCALISRIHPQQILRLLEEEEYEILRELTYTRAH